MCDFVKIPPAKNQLVLPKHNATCEVFRRHKFPLIHIGFLNNHEYMVSVDIAGHIYVWDYDKCAPIFE